MYARVLYLALLATLITLVQVASIDNYFLLPLRNTEEYLPNFLNKKTYNKDLFKKSGLHLNKIKNNVESVVLNENNKFTKIKNYQSDINTYTYNINKQPKYVNKNNNIKANSVIEKSNQLISESTSTNYNQNNALKRYHYENILNPLLQKNINNYAEMNNNIVEINTLKHFSSPNIANSNYEKKDIDQVDSATESTFISKNLTETNNNVLDQSVQEEIKEILLALLKIERPPIIDRTKVIIPEFMIQLYELREGLNGNYVARSFSHKENPWDKYFPYHNKFRLYFDIQSIPREEHLKTAELQLSRDLINEAILNPQLLYTTSYQVHVYIITKLNLRKINSMDLLPLVSKTVWLNSTETIRLNVKKAVERWRFSSNNYGFLVEVKLPNSYQPAPHDHVRLRRRTDEEENHWRLKQPYLVTYTNDESPKKRSVRDLSENSKRVTRTRQPHHRKKGEPICERLPLYVDFVDVGWSDWVIAPPGFDAFYCEGRCPFPLPDHLNSTNHAVIQTIANNINPNKVPQACCAPTELEGNSFLYLNDKHTVVLKTYQDMTVVGCGCL